MAAFNGQACTREECKLSPRWNGGFVLVSNALSIYALKLGRYLYYTAHACLLAYVYCVPACKFSCWHLQTAATAYVCHSRTTQARRQSALVAVEPAQLRQLHEGECINAVGWPKLWRPPGGPGHLRLAWPIRAPNRSNGARRPMHRSRTALPTHHPRPPASAHRAAPGGGATNILGRTKANTESTLASLAAAMPGSHKMGGVRFRLTTARTQARDSEKGCGMKCGS